ncbi:DUF551 domain-containing protein [Klebsiella pneumoniae]|uniref:DUF551 domain-containing protein n=1 Tax=Klebsiella pneumoniae TaxID=573 RepID=UPI003D6793D3
MTKSTITDERITSVIERLKHYACNLKWTNVRGAQDLLAAADGLRELQERRKADSEPVAWRRFQETPTDGGYWILYDYRPNCSGVEPLYRHAQPAPVVPDDVLKALQKVARIRLDLNDFDGDRRGIADCLGDAEEALIEVVNRRAAMLKAQSDDDGEPTDDERIMAIEGIHNCERCGDEGWVVGEMGITRCACNQGNPVFKIDLNSDFIKHVKVVSEKVRAGNSPAIPDGYVMVPKEPTDEMLAAAKEWTGLTSTAEVVYIKMLAAAPQSPGSEPATVPGKWIPVSERMPESNGVYFGWDGKRVLEVYCFFGGFSANQFIHGEITHWMPLPAAPQEDINALIPLASRNEQEGK